MGYMRHHAIIVTGWNDQILKAHAFAMKEFPDVSPIIESVTNGYKSFFVPPDGSKEGWEESEEGDGKRDIFKKHLQGYAYDDGSSPLDWVEVQYGDDEGITFIVDDSDKERRGI